MFTSRILPASLVLLGLFPCAAPAAEDLTIADFEGVDLGAWKITGEAFGSAPASGPLERQLPVDGFEGKGFLSSFHGGDGATGDIVSPPFTVERRYLNFLIGGGGFGGITCMNLLSNGKVVRTATGPNTRPGGSEHLSPQSWDLADLRGKEVAVEIVDKATGGWGHISVDQIVLSDTPPPSAEELFAKEINARVESRAAQAAGDPARPIYHLMPKSQSVGDPNGPVYFNGEYHVFYQSKAFWGTSFDGTAWGHVVSKDFVHWEHLPIALAPGANAFDAGGVWSGGCMIANGVPTIVYSGNSAGNRQVQCIATSSDNLRTWKKEPSNPVIAEQPPIEGLDRAGFRDPFCWKEGDEWRMLVGSGYGNGKGGTVLLYGSKDTRKWGFIGPLAEGMGNQCFMWECPTFFPLESKQVLVVSPLFHNVPGTRGDTQYSVGSYHNNRFEPREWKPVDLGGSRVFYAATSFADGKGRRILWGFIMTPQGPAAGWNNCLSLPRVVTPGKDSTVSFSPVPEMAALRTNERARDQVTLKAGQEIVLDESLGLNAEVALEVEMNRSDKIDLRFGRSTDGKQFTTLSYDKKSGTIAFGDKKADFKPDPDDRLRIRLFLDGCVAEAFINDKVCFTNIVAVNKQSMGVSVVATGDSATLLHSRLWQMNSIWSGATPK